ncbi:MAG: efflux RND transporter permease subunit [Ignavibacteriales bacterium]|nr:efflux RND transporter permease subunit [Ignavibacteriales bacterium]
MTLTELSIKRPSLIIIIFSALAVLGIFSFNQLRYELLPKFSPPVLTISTVYPGASPYEVEAGVSKPIEDALSGLDKVSTIRSTSMEGVSFVIVELLQSANTDISLQEAQRKVNEVIAKLPTGAKAPTISKISLDEIPVLRLGITSNMDKKAFTQFLKDQVKPQLARVPGVGQINLIGGEEREIKVNIDQEKLRAYGLSLMNVNNSIKNSNLDFPTGNIKDQDGQYVVRVAGKYNSIEELRSLSIGKSKSGGQILLSDIAEVEDGSKEATNIVRLNLQSTVSMSVVKQSDANSVDVSALVRKQLTMLEEKYQHLKLKFEIASDGSTFTIDAANAVKEDLLIAVMLVAMVMLMFLHSVRNSVIVMIAIPSSLISTFVAMYAFGFTLNLMTLLGLSLVVGILVDDSIVVLENIYHYIEKGLPKRQAALTGRNEIGFAALAITLVDVAVFLPLALVSGIIGNIMRQFSLVIVISTLLSLFVSFTITPMLASRFAKLERLTNKSLLGKFALAFERLYHTVSDDYLKVLAWSLKNRWKTIMGAFSLLIITMMLVPAGFVGSEFMPQSDRGEFAVTLELPAGANLEETNKLTNGVEKWIKAFPEVERTMVNVGVSNEGLIGFASNNTSEINVTLTPRKTRKKSTDDVSEEIKKYVQTLPGVKARVNPIGIFGTANQTPIQMVVSAPNPDDVNKWSKILMDKVKKVPGTADVRLSSEDGKPETRIVIDRDKLNYFGLSIAEVGGALRVALTGDDDSKYRDGTTEYDIRIQLDEFNRSKTADVGKISFLNKKNEHIELQQFASVIHTSGPTKLQRQDRNACVFLYSQVAGRPSGSISADIEKEIKNLPLPPGVEITFAGDVKNQKESFASLALAMMAAVLFTYMIMVALYDSFIYPFVVLFSIPLAMIGAILALALSMKALSIFSILGIIMLVGLVGKNAILLVDRTNQMREEGLEVHGALMDAGKMRLRPILMTTFTMIFGMMPIALSTASGAEWKTGLAWGLIGGLTSSLMLTLVVVPSVYSIVEEWRVKVASFLKRKFNIGADEAALAEAE